MKSSCMLLLLPCLYSHLLPSHLHPPLYLSTPCHGHIILLRLDLNITSFVKAFPDHELYSPHLRRPYSGCTAVPPKSESPGHLEVSTTFSSSIKLVLNSFFKFPVPRTYGEAMEHTLSEHLRYGRQRMTGWLRLLSPISPRPSFIYTCHSSIFFYPKYKLLKLEFSHPSTWCSPGFSNNGRKLQCNNMMISICRISFPPITSCSSYML